MWRNNWRPACLAIGLIVWAAATLVLRVSDIAQFAGPPLSQGLVYLLGAAGIVVLIWLVARGFAAPPLETAALLALPGMMLDAVTIRIWSAAFPNHAGAEAAFGGLMLWLYSVAFLAGLLLQRRSERLFDPGKAGPSTNDSETENVSPNTAASRGR